jgi:hypothetical protein
MVVESKVRCLLFPVLKLLIVAHSYRIGTSDLINWMSFTLLASNPTLFQDLSILLKLRSERVVVSTTEDDQTVEYVILLSGEVSDPHAQIIPISSFAKNAACIIRDSRIVRHIFGTSDPISYFLDVEAFWAPGVMELLQFVCLSFF